jgi:hypothetical protein
LAVPAKQERLPTAPIQPLQACYGSVIQAAAIFP